MNVNTRRMMCFGCGLLYDATPWFGGAWHITQVTDNPVPYLVSAARPTCLSPKCGGRFLEDMNSERVTTDGGHTIPLAYCERPGLN